MTKTLQRAWRWVRHPFKLNGVPRKDLVHRHLLTGVLPMGATYDDPSGNTRPILALDVMGLNGVGRPTRNLLLLEPQAAIELGKILTAYGECATPDDSASVPSTEQATRGYL